MRPPGDPPFFVSALVAVPCRLVLMAVAVPLARRRVPPNAWYGLRVPATFADREVWYAANARARSAATRQSRDDKRGPAGPWTATPKAARDDVRNGHGQGRLA